MSTLTLKFFARLREELNVDELVIDASEVSRLSDLRPYLIGLHPEWKEFLDKILMTAVNQQMVTSDLSLKPGDEIALFPPVTGG